MISFILRMISIVGKKMDWLCLLATGLFIASNTIRAVYLQSFHSRMHWDEDRTKQFDPPYIQLEWDWRIGYRVLEVPSGILNAIAWFFLAVPILQVAWIQSSRGNISPALHIMVCMLAVGGALTEFISQILILGASNALQWIAQEFELHNWISGGSGNDGVGYKVLELVHITTTGMTMWVGAMEWLFLSGIFLLLFVSVVRSRRQPDHIFGMMWATFGLILAAFFAAEFVTCLIRFESFGKLSGMARFVSFLNRFLLFPAWLLWLGRQLPRAVQEDRNRAANNQVVKIYDGKSAVNSGQVLAFSHNSKTGEWDMPESPTKTTKNSTPDTPDTTGSSSHDEESHILEEVKFFD